MIRRGQITVFMSMLLVTVLSLLFAIVESARVQGAKVQAEHGVDLALFSAFAQYDRKLLEKYDVFFMDEGKGFLQDSIREYCQDNLKPGRAPVPGGSVDFYALDVEEVALSGYVRATDEGGKAFREQAVLYMKDKLPLSVVQEVSRMLPEKDILKRNETLVAQQEKNADQAQKDVKNLLEAEEGEEDGESVTLSEAEKKKGKEAWNDGNPLELIGTLRRNGILNLVVKDPKSVSGKRVDTAILPSRRALQTDGGSYQPMIEEGMFADLCFGEYIMEKYSHMQSGRDSAMPLDYEVEYILEGKSSDLDNIKAVVNRLLLMRQAANLLYLATDSPKRQEALALATALAGFTGMPVVIKAVQGAILLAWAFGESVVEIRRLLAGGKIPVVKTAQNWNLALTNLVKLTGNLDSEDTEDQGLSYGDFLRIFLFLEDESVKSMRCLDILEQNIRCEEKNPGFSIDRCVAGFKAQIRVAGPQLFFGLPALPGVGGQSVEFQVSKDFSYQLYQGGE